MFGWFSKKKQTPLSPPTPQASAPAPYFQRAPPYDPSQPQPEQRLHWPPAQPADYVTPLGRPAPVLVPAPVVNATPPPSPLKPPAPRVYVQEPPPRWLERLAQARESWEARKALIAMYVDAAQEEAHTQLSSMTAFMFNYFDFCTLLELPEEHVDQSLLPGFGQWFAQAVADRLDLNAYRMVMVARMGDDRASDGNAFSMDLEHYMEEFEIYRAMYLLGTFGLVSDLERSLESFEPMVDEAWDFVEALDFDGQPEMSRDKLLAYTRSLLPDVPAFDEQRWVEADCPAYLRAHLLKGHETAGCCFVNMLIKRLKEREVAGSKLTIKAMQENTPAVSAAADGVAFEQRLKVLVVQSFADAEIQITPVSGDHGADLLVRLGSVLMAIQAKRYTGVVGNAAVKEIFAAKQFYDADFAMVVTNSRYTQPAQVLADKLDVSLATEDDFIRQIQQLLT